MRIVFHESKTFVPMMLAYGLIFSGLWWTSKNLETVPGAISWFLPAGFRITALCLVPRGRWWTLWLAEMASSIFLTKLDVDYSGILSATAAAAGPMVSYMTAMTISMRLTSKTHGHTIEHFPTIALASMLGASFYGCMWATNLVGMGIATAEDLITLALSIALGDLVGIALFLPPLMVIIKPPLSLSIFPLMVAPAALAILLVANIDIEPYQYLLRVAMLIGVAVVAQRFGMRAACMSSWGVSVFIVASEFFEADLGTLEENQLAIIFVTLAALSLGHSVDKQDALAKQLDARNAKLKQLNDDHQALAQRLVAVSETERDSIAREIHDGLGQMLASIRIKLQLLHPASTSQRHLVDELDRLVSETYDTARVLMNQLTPDALIDLGLEEALRASDIEGMCSDANIDCHLTVQINQPLSNTLQLQLFRIIQEASHNCVKYACASSLSIYLKTKDDTLTLKVRDNGLGFDPDRQSSGRGLTNIRDRATLINAHYTLTTSNKGTEHFLMINLADK